MENVTVGWINRSGGMSEHTVPTLWIGRRNIDLGSRNDIDLVILYGYEKMGQDYIANLEQTGYTIIDGSRLYQKYSKDYACLNRFGIYEKNCFLRWLILKDLYGGSSLIYYDGDIVFNEIPEILEKKFGRFTFVLQGCPAFVSIKNPSWLEDYKRNLDLFCNNIESYSSNAWKERRGWEKSLKDKWAGYRVRKIISSDQDLISHLIHTDRIIQDNTMVIKASCPDLILFQNPLYFFTHNLDLAPFYYNREQGIDFFNGRKVAFWHMQGAFIDYLRAAFILRYLFKIPVKVTNPLELENNTTFKKMYGKVNYKIRSSLHVVLDRLTICKIFFNIYDFSKVFGKDAFWTYPISSEDFPTSDFPFHEDFEIMQNNR